MTYTLDTFYRCDDWRRFRDIVMADRLTDDGLTICEYCGKPIVRAYDIILHHCNTFLTEDNVNDVEISLNPDNIMLIHHRCHNFIHNKLGYKRKEIYLVYGPPLSGKTTWVKDNANENDLIIDMNNIWECVNSIAADKGYKPMCLNSIVFGVRDYLIESVRIRRGRWNNAYVVGGYPLISERERLCRSLGAREIFIEASKDECLERIKLDAQRSVKDWTMYIDDWWKKYGGPPASPIKST